MPLAIPGRTKDAVVVVAAGRRQRPDDIASFRRQIDALSPEARRGISALLEFIKGLVDAGGNMVMLFDVDNFMHHPDIYDDSAESAVA